MMFDWDRSAHRRRQAVKDFRAAGERLSVRCQNLGATDDPHQRAQILLAMHYDQQARADLYLAAFGPGPALGEDDRYMVAILNDSALLLRLLSETEGFRRQQGADQIADWSKSGISVPWPQAIPILDRLRDTTDLDVRANLVDLLYAAVVGTVGAQAAELLHLVSASYRCCPVWPAGVL